MQTGPAIIEYLRSVYPASPSQREIATAVGKSVSTVNSRLDLLERDGLVGRHGNERRVYLISERTGL